jgi:hypothetical protein
MGDFEFFSWITKAYAEGFKISEKKGLTCKDDSGCGGFKGLLWAFFESMKGGIVYRVRHYRYFEHNLPIGPGYHDHSHGNCQDEEKSKNTENKRGRLPPSIR